MKVAKLLAGGGGGGDVELEELEVGPARAFGGCRCTTVLDESEVDGEDEEGEATDDEGTRDWKSRYLVLSLSNGLADRLIPLR